MSNDPLRTGSIFRLKDTSVLRSPLPKRTSIEFNRIKGDGANTSSPLRRTHSAFPMPVPLPPLNKQRSYVKQLDDIVRSSPVPKAVQAYINRMRLRNTPRPEAPKRKSLASHDTIAHQPEIPNPPLISHYDHDGVPSFRPIPPVHASSLPVFAPILPPSFKNNFASSPANLPRSSRFPNPTSSESATEGELKRESMPQLISSKDTGSTCSASPNPAGVSTVKLEPNLSQSHTAIPVTEPWWKDDRSDGLTLPVKMEGHREPSSSPVKYPQKLIIAAAAAADASSKPGSVDSGIPQSESKHAGTLEASSPCPETETASTHSGEANVICDVSTNVTDVSTPTSAVASSSITQRRSRRRSKSRKAVNIHSNINAVVDDSAITHLSKWYLDVDESQNLVLNAIDDSNESVIRSIIKRRLQPRQLVLKEGNRRVLLGGMDREKMSKTFPDSVVNALRDGLPHTFEDIIRYFRAPDSSMKASGLKEATKGTDEESSIKSDIVPIRSTDSLTETGPLRRSRRSSGRFSQSSSAQSEKQLETDVIKESGDLSSFVFEPAKVQRRSEKLDRKKLKSFATEDVPSVSKLRTSSKPNPKKTKAKTVSEPKSEDLTRTPSKPNPKKPKSKTVSGPKAADLTRTPSKPNLKKAKTVSEPKSSDLTRTLSKPNPKKTKAKTVSEPKPDDLTRTPSKPNPKKAKAKVSKPKSEDLTRTPSKPNPKKATAKTVSKPKSADLTKQSKPSKKRMRSLSAPKTRKGRGSVPEAGVDDLKPLDITSPGVKLTRSGRVTMKPLQFWKSERIVSHLFEDKAVTFVPSKDEPAISLKFKSPVKTISREKRSQGKPKSMTTNRTKASRKSTASKGIKRGSSKQKSSSSQANRVKESVNTKQQKAWVNEALLPKGSARSVPLRATSAAPTSQNGVWTDDETNLLRSVHAVVDPREKHFWSRVAEFLPGKSDRECQRQFESLFPTPQPKSGSRSQRNRPPDNLPSLIEEACRTTKPSAKRRRLLNQAIASVAADGPADDFFDGIREAQALSSVAGAASDLSRFGHSIGEQPGSISSTSLRNTVDNATKSVSRLDRDRTNAYVNKVKAAFSKSRKEIIKTVKSSTVKPRSDAKAQCRALFQKLSKGARRKRHDEFEGHTDENIGDMSQNEFSDNSSDNA